MCPNQAVNSEELQDEVFSSSTNKVKEIMLATQLPFTKEKVVVLLLLVLKFEFELRRGKLYSKKDRTSITYIEGANTQMDQTVELVIKNIIY